ncbi:MAG: tRNA 2-selenouridine(34) synthase MnmH [Pseudomonadota bacterium]
MSIELQDLTAPPWSDFDALIDVRSPAEFALDHIPGAMNLPVLSNAERAQIGTIYTQDSPFKARKIGAALVARNAAAHIEDHLLVHDGGWRPLVYCWRGGQRSGAFATILRQIGWRAETLAGGYQSYRRCVVAGLYDTTLPYRVLLLDGYTGTGKTALLARLADLGIQVIDLEGMAQHRGSALGGLHAPQPSQKGFETALSAALAKFNPAKPILVEAESARIGQLRVPPALWTAMQRAPRVMLAAPVAARAAYLADIYAALMDDLPALAARLDKLRPHLGHSQIDAWIALAQSGAAVPLAQALIEMHYDPVYARLHRAQDHTVAARFQTESLDSAALDALACDIADWLSSV